MSEQPSKRRRIFRKVVVWAVLLTIGIPNILLGEPGMKVVGLIFTAIVIVWDIVASRNEKGRNSKIKHRSQSDKHEATEEITINIAVNSAYCADIISKKYPPEDLKDERSKNTTLYLIMFLITIMKKGLNPALSSEDTSKISEDIYLKVLNEHFAERKFTNRELLEMLDYYEHFDKGFGDLPIERSGDSLKNTLLWEFSKLIYKTSSGKNLENAFTSMEIVRILNQLVLQSKVVLLSKKLNKQVIK